jgi:hypothetical protein
VEEIFLSIQLRCPPTLLSNEYVYYLSGKSAPICKWVGVIPRRPSAPAQASHGMTFFTFNFYCPHIESYKMAVFIETAITFIKLALPLYY